MASEGDGAGRGGGAGEEGLAGGVGVEDAGVEVGRRDEPAAVGRVGSRVVGVARRRDQPRRPVEVVWAGGGAAVGVGLAGVDD